MVIADFYEIIIITMMIKEGLYGTNYRFDVFPTACFVAKT